MLALEIGYHPAPIMRAICMRRDVRPITSCHNPSAISGNMPTVNQTLPHYTIYAMPDYLRNTFAPARSALGLSALLCFPHRKMTKSDERVAIAGSCETRTILIFKTDTVINDFGIGSAKEAFFHRSSRLKMLCLNLCTQKFASSPRAAEPGVCA